MRWKTAPYVKLILLYNRRIEVLKMIEK